MLESFQKYLAPPKFEDLEKDRKARVLNSIIIIITGTIIILESFFIIWDLFTGERFPEDELEQYSMLFSIIILIVSFGLKRLLQKGHIQSASIIFTSIIFLSGIIGIAPFGGIRNTNIVFFILAITLSSILLSQLATYIFIVLGLLATFLIFLNQSSGLLTTNLPTEATLKEWFTFAILFVLIGFLLNLAAKSIQEGYQKTRSSEQALTATKIELETIQTTLQDHAATIERRVQYLEAAAEVGRTATSIYKLEELLPQVANFISERFGFYQVGIFLLDDRGEYAVMRSASSEGGQRMLARSHRLRVGAEGIVGYVTGTGKARIALDVGEDAAYFDTPELPQTRSEMALPLFYDGRLFGALDVQSTEPNAFSDDDVSALSVLADQVSMAINNAQLFEQLQSSIESERRAYGEISRGVWKDLIGSKDNWGYRFSNNRTDPVGDKWSDDMIKAASTEKPVISEIDNHRVLTIPIQISDQVVGIIQARKGGGHVNWSKDEVELMQTLTDRISQALEGARLFEETQRLAQREGIAADVSSRIWASTDVDTILQTAVQELGRALKVSQGAIRLRIPEEGDADGNPGNPQVDISE